ncbi:DUF1272 domain-containing protein [Pandoraea sputorum]|uniref:DUF1272 domain-containing protein n=1 Tax=Pandoraea sputorum TaxID=93222 RepID=UPI001242062C|nr:DUF1272 domain-containing protein [Pandoraea sputorum]VVE83801.1 hypothetical protein PSP31120_04326 [Pandoraea sputorum]
MLQLRPSCEHCAVALPPESTQARICSFECTFCATCVDAVLENVCPNCGGGFAPRPIRPTHDWRNGNNVSDHPPTSVVTHKPVDTERHRVFASDIRGIAPQDR